MPNITTYLDNVTYIAFLKLSDKRRSEIKRNVKKYIKECVGLSKGDKDG